MENKRSQFRALFIGLLVLIGCCWFAPTALGQCIGNMTAPDRSMTVKVTWLNSSREGLIEFLGTNGRLRLKENYSSPDMNHGEVIAECAWTPDSKFFIYSTYSSGGHQAWSFPTLFYTQTQNRVYRLDNLVGPVTEPDFHLSAPDVLHAVGWVVDKGQVQIIRKVAFDPSVNAPNFEYAVSLSKLLSLAHKSKSK